MANLGSGMKRRKPLASKAFWFYELKPGMITSPPGYKYESTHFSRPAAIRAAKSLTRYGFLYWGEPLI